MLSPLSMMRPRNTEPQEGENREGLKKKKEKQTNLPARLLLLVDLHGIIKNNVHVLIKSLKKKKKRRKEKTPE